jgi:hypothetical protein
LSRSLADTTVRKAGRGFKSLVFIALNPEGPNLPLDGFCESDDVEEDVEMPDTGDSDVVSGSESDQSTFKKVSDGYLNLLSDVTGFYVGIWQSSSGR